MPYLLEMVTTGKVIEVTKKYSYWYHKRGMKRGAKKKQTPEEQKKANLKAAETKLRRLINTNFSGGDYHLILTYRKADRPDDGTAKKELEKFQRKMRAAYKKLGKEYKYITATEKGSRGVIHHHLIINKIDLDEIRKAWPWGRPKIYPLDDTGQYGELASYIIKETEKNFRDKDAVQKKRWNASKNLKKPKIKTKIIKRDSYSEDPQPKKGYYIEKESVYKGIQANSGYPYLFYSMRRLEEGHKNQ